MICAETMGRGWMRRSRGVTPPTSGRRPALAACLAALLLLAPVSAGAETVRRVPASEAEVTLSFAPVVRRVVPAVVNVYASRVVAARSLSPFFDDPFFRRFFGDGGGGPRQRLQSSLGSGVIVEGGLVVTNNHVIENADEVRVALADRREFDADVVLKDEGSDLAVLKIRAAPTDLPTIPFGESDALEVGDIVLAVGNPFGVGQTVTQGIVSAVARTQVGITDYQFFIQTDAAINPGNSGGALVDMAGRLVGINTAIFSRGGGSNGIGFAIPANMVRLVVDAARTGSVVRRPWFGAALQAVTAEIAESPGSTGRGAPSSPPSTTADRRRRRGCAPATWWSPSTASRSTIPTPSAIASRPAAPTARRTSPSFGTGASGPSPSASARRRRRCRATNGRSVAMRPCRAPR